eukprot:Sspe_Gene.21432::Locus_8034_Transcript_1_1_Confidence_1.000_Length_2053::g.21432::m.21432/K00854/xylB, XYLB; xylulokinase
MSGDMYLGVDLGSQSLKLFIIDANLEPITEATVGFDKELPHYCTTGGFHINGKRVTGPTLMWVEAMERCLAQLKANKAPLDRVVAISGSAQQHGSVYWKNGSLSKLQHLDPKRTLSEQLGDCFLTESPVWMDASTTEDCLALERAMGGAQEVSKITGSRAFERFTGNQISKLLREEPETMAQCERISLISSFLASLLTGGYAPIDVSDGSGMNLLDIKTRTWSAEAVNAIAAQYRGKGTYNLGGRLGEVVESFAPVGTISPYYAQRFGLNNKCRVIAFSGDNNNAMVGLKLCGDDMAVSMGTSDTIFASLRKATPCEVGHVFAHPIIPGAFMAMLCYSNGSLTREHIRNQVVGSDWGKFETALKNTPPGNKGHIGFYFVNPEIIPQGATGIHRFGPSGERVEAFPDKKQDIRGVVEGQFLSMRLHAAQLGLEITSKSRIFVTGGGSRSTGMLQVLADVFGCSIYKDTKSAVNSAAFGAALRACHGNRLLQKGTNNADSEGLYQEMTTAQQTFDKIASPNPKNHELYTEMLKRYEALELKVVKGLSKL